MSRTCIGQEKRCDGHVDCPHKEDEMDCAFPAALTNGLTIDLDKDGRANLQTKGLLTLYQNGKSQVDRPGFHSGNTEKSRKLLRALCQVAVETLPAAARCTTAIWNTPVSCICRPGWRLFTWKDATSAWAPCWINPGLSLRKNASKAFTGGKSSLKTRSFETRVSNLWTIPSSFELSYVVAVLGKGKLHLTVPGPHEQIVRIQNISSVPGTDIVLLRLADKVRWTRYVQAADLDAWWDGEKREKCYAVGRTMDENVRFLPLFPRENCTAGYRCFERKLEDDCQDNNAWMGTIICDSRLGWYPAAVFHERLGHCGFSFTRQFTSIRYYRHQIRQLMEMKIGAGATPKCDGFRCQLGTCLAQGQVCNGVQECYDGSDESATLCYESENKCYLNNQCAASRKTTLSSSWKIYILYITYYKLFCKLAPHPRISTQKSSTN
ncbi:hypothetical protein YQE_02792, partial [Dendroctonus ponderosae]